ncbi:MAG: glycosyltransferase family 9 protein [Verrucomicrobiota bacterium]|nr:glycosyltransferase family 9 protein [Verrucomicrobiota bacterium]
MNKPCSVKRPRILIIRGGAIGDFVLTLPVLSALCERFPKADLEILGYPRIASLALDGGLVKAVHALESPELAMFFSEHGMPDLEWREFFAEFSIIISYLYDPDKIFEANVKSCGVQQFIAAQYRPDETKMIHASELFLKPLEILTIFESDPVARLSIGPEFSLESCLALHPGSGSESKNWPEKDWRELIEYLLHNSSLQLLLIGGEAEGEKLQRLADGMPIDRLEIMQNIPLNKLAKRLTRCCGYIGHDSGITHIASALSLPTLVLWGPSCEAVWKPLGERVRILNQNNQLSEITLNHVVRELSALKMDLN